MSFRSPEAALDAYRSTVVTALGCVARPFVQIEPRGNPLTTMLSLVANRGTLIRLRAPTPLSLTVIEGVRLVSVEGRWRTTLAAYRYTLRDERHEIVAYHWHPEQTANVPFPHLHLEAGAGIARDELTRAHLPTGFVPLAAVLRLAITDFGVEPLRDDWQEVLVHTEAATTREQLV